MGIFGKKDKDKAKAKDKKKGGLFGGYKTRQEQLEAQEAKAMGLKPKKDTKKGK